MEQEHKITLMLVDMELLRSVNVMAVPSLPERRLKKFAKLDERECPIGFLRNDMV